MAGGTGSRVELQAGSTPEPARRAASLSRLVRGTLGARARPVVRARVECDCAGACASIGARRSRRGRPARFRHESRHDAGGSAGGRPRRGASGVQSRRARIGGTIPRSHRSLQPDRHGGRASDRIRRRRLGLPATAARFFGSQPRRARGDGGLAARFPGGDPDHSRHFRQLGVRDGALLRHGQPAGLPVRHALGTGPDEQRRDPGSIALWRAAAVLGNGLYRCGRSDGRRDPARPDERNLPHAVCEAPASSRA